MKTVIDSRTTSFNSAKNLKTFTWNGIGNMLSVENPEYFESVRGVEFSESK